VWVGMFQSNHTAARNTTPVGKGIETSAQMPDAEPYTLDFTPLLPRRLRLIFWELII
jgi:hypothetical protein